MKPSVHKILATFVVFGGILLSHDTDTYAQTTESQNGLSYLTGSQNPDGSWGGTATSTTENFPSTTEAVKGLRLLESTPSAQQTNGINYITAQSIEESDYIARRIESLLGTGSSVSNDLSALLALKNTDKAWGGAAGFTSDVLDSALALIALRAEGSSDPVLLNQTANYLVASQNLDGGWGLVLGDLSSLHVTSLVIQALSGVTQTPSIANAITAGSAFLLAHQNPDGGFGSSPSTVWETAEVFKAVVDSGQSIPSEGALAISYILTTQQANGSWNDDPYSTALALQALARARPNLKVTPAAISTVPTPPTLGDPITLTADIQNTGFEDASNVIVSFYDGDPSAGGTLIGDTSVPNVPANGSSLASVPWPGAISGTHVVYVVSDSGSAVTETNEGDNQAAVVVSIVEKMDLAISDLAPYPALPAPDQDIRVEVKVANLGGQTASGAIVRLSVDGGLFGEQTVSSLSGGNSHTAIFDVPGYPDNTHTLTATVDPDNALSEGNETNNSASQSVTFAPRIDLVGNNAALFISNLEPSDGQIIRLAALVENGRESAASNVLVRFFDGDPASGGIQIGADQIIANIPGGGSATTGEVSYNTYGKAGFHIVHLLIDPLDAIEETDEDNNFAVGFFNVAGRPDLVIEDLTFTPPTPEEGDLVLIQAVLRNLGTASAGPHVVQFFLGDPSAGGSQIGLNVFMASNLAAGAAITTPAVTFNTAGHLAGSEIHAVADALGAIDEANENNNVRNETLTVAASSRPDLTIAPEDIAFDPEKPADGDTVTITAIVRNLKNLSASDIPVAFYDGDPASGGTPIGSAVIPSLAGNGAGSAQATWNVSGLFGAHVVFIVIDSGNAILEADEANNTASRSIGIRLPGGAAPLNLSAIPSGADAVDLAWTAGPDAATYGVVGYHVYRNEIRATDYLDLARTGTSSTSTSSLPHQDAIDGDDNTAWRPALNAPAPQWWLDTFPAPVAVSRVAIHWNAPYIGSDYEIQTWDGAQWVTQVSITGNTGQITVDDFPAPVTTDQVRVSIATSVNAAYRGSIKEIDLYQKRVVGGLVHTDSPIGRGAYDYYVTAVDADGVESLPSNTAQAALGDFLAPASPTGLAGSFSGSSLNLTWNANTEPDLSGYKIHRGGLNAALDGRGAVVYQTGGSRPEKVNDGISGGINNDSVTTIPLSEVTIILAKSHQIDRIRLKLPTGIETYRYRIDASTDGENWLTVLDKSAGDYSGWQEHVLSPPVVAGWFRIIGTFTSESDAFFRVEEFEAYAQDSAPLTLDSIANPTGTEVTDYTNFEEFSKDIAGSGLKPRRFFFESFETQPEDVLSIYDKDTGALLAAYSGNIGPFMTPPLTATNYRFKFTADHAGSGAGFKLSRIITLSPPATAGGSETLYENADYTYTVTAIDASGNESASSAAFTGTVADATPPAPPQNVGIIAGNGVVEVNWFNDNRPPDLAGYNVYRDGGTSPLNGGTLIAPITQLFEKRAYKDFTVTNGTAYSYQVTAVDVNGNESARTAPVTGTPKGADLSMPGGILISPTAGTVFETAVITAIVTNTGTDTIDGTTVAFYDGNPATGGALIGAVAVPGPLQPASTGAASIEWNLLGQEGSHVLYAVVDPGQLVVETNEGNNQTYRAFDVAAEPVIQIAVQNVRSEGFPEIEVALGVKDGSGAAVFGLDENHFTAAENGLPAAPLTVTPLLGVAARKADVVFLVDSSGSMDEEWETLCGVLETIIEILAANEIDLSPAIYSLAADRDCGTALTDVVFNGQIQPAQSEDWAPAATWAALYYPWREGAARIVIPISDENAYNGTPQTQADLDAVLEAIETSLARGIRAYPFAAIAASNPTQIEIEAEMLQLAEGTGGRSFSFENPFQVANDIVSAVQESVSDYRVTYTTPNPSRDGTVRNVTIAVTYGPASGAGSGQYTAPFDDRADLAVQSLDVSNPTPEAGETVTLTAGIQNLGGAGATNAVVRFFDGDPSTGTPIGSDQIISLSGGQTVVVSVDWPALPGTHAIHVVADADDTVTEMDEANNGAFATVTTLGEGLPDLSIASEDIAFSNETPSRAEAITIQTTVRNTGIAATNVSVRAYVGDPLAGGAEIGSATLSTIPASGSSVVSFPWTVDRPQGVHTVFIWVDASDAVSESDEADNTASRSLSVGGKPLSVTITTDQGAYAAGSDVSMTVTAQNAGSAPWSGTAKVLIEDAQENLVHELSAFPVDLPAGAPPTALPGWAHRIRLTIDPAGVETDLSDFPVLVRLSAASGIDATDVSAIFDALGQNARKIAVTGSDEVTQRYVEIESWEAASREAILWVRVPLVGATEDTVLYLYYDAAQSDNEAFVGWPGETAARSVWGPSYQAVYHLAGDPSGAAPQMPDSSPNQFHGTANGGMTGADSIPGAVGPALRFDGVNDYVDVGTLGSFGSEIGHSTVSAWVKTAHTAAGTAILKIIDDPNNVTGGNDVVYGIEPNRALTTGCTTAYTAGSTLFYVRDATGNIVFARHITANLYDNQWHQVVWRLVNAPTNTMEVYLDGLPQTLVGACSGSPSNFIQWTDRMYLGAQNNRGTAGTFFNGRIDEVRFSASALSPAWIQTSHAADRDTLIHFGAPEAVDHAGTPAIQTFNFSWNTGDTLAGNYRAHAILQESGVAVADGASDFAILPDVGLASSLTADKIAYSANETVRLDSDAVNFGTNGAVTGLIASLTVTDGLGATVFSSSRNLGDLLPGAGTTFPSFWNTETNAAGTYTAQLSLSAAGGLASVSTTTFNIISSLEQARSLTGSVAVDPETIIEGEVTDLSYAVQNIGNDIDIPEVMLEILVVDPVTAVVHRTLTDFASLNDREVFANRFTFDAAGLPPATYLLILRGVIGEAVQTLDAAPLIINPIPNSAPTADAGGDVIGFSGQTAVLDGTGSADPDGDPLLYAWSFASVPEGSARTDADITGADTAAPSFIPDAAGIYTVSLVVSDGLLSSQTDTVQVFVSPPLDVDLHPETISLKSKGGSTSVTVVLFHPLISGFELLTAGDGTTVTAVFSVTHAYTDLNGDLVTFTTPVADYPGDDFVMEVDLDGNGTPDGYQLTLKVDRQAIIAGFTDSGGTLQILENTELTSTVFGDGIQLGSDLNRVLPP